MAGSDGAQGPRGGSGPRGPAGDRGPVGNQVKSAPTRCLVTCRLLRLILPVFPVCRVLLEKMVAMVTGGCKATL